MDSGATHHITNNDSGLSQLTCYSSSDGMLVRNGGKMPIVFTGSTILPCCSDNILHLNIILYVPVMTTKLISINKLCQDNSIFYRNLW